MTHCIDLDSWYRIGTPESHTYERAECYPYAGFFENPLQICIVYWMVSIIFLWWYRWYSSVFLLMENNTFKTNYSSQIYKQSFVFMYKYKSDMESLGHKHQSQVNIFVSTSQSIFLSICFPYQKRKLEVRLSIFTWR